MQAFEQEIADQLLKNLPDIPTVRTQKASTRLIAELDALLNQSGVNRKLLTPEQQRRFAALSLTLSQLKSDQVDWQQRNHFADFAKVQLEPEDSIQRQQVIDAIKYNLQEQRNSGIFYPKRLLGAGLKAAEGAGTALPLALQSGPGSETDWISNRLNPYFSRADLARAKSGLKDLLNKQPEAVQADFYLDQKYDIRTEAQPEQLSLDIISLHAEEALSFSGYNSALDVKGVASGLLTPLTALNEANSETLLIAFDRTLALPAFELQTLAYLAAGNIVSRQPWSYRWRQTHALAEGIQLTQQLNAKDYFTSGEAKLGLAVRQRLLIQFGILEIEIATGELDIDDARVYLLAETPYDASHIDGLLLEFLAFDGSYAAAALIAHHSSNIDKTEHLDELLRLLSEAIGPADASRNQH